MGRKRPLSMVSIRQGCMISGVQVKPAMGVSISCNRFRPGRVSARVRLVNWMPRWLLIPNSLRQATMVVMVMGS